MVADVCFPNNDEKDFLDMANKLGVLPLIFIYQDKKKAIDIHSTKRAAASFGFFEKKHGFFEEISLIGTDIRFCYIPDLNTNITQVQIKEIASLSLPLLIQVGQIKSTKTPDFLKRLSFVARLCKKYKLSLLPVSGAKSPLLLLSKKDLDALFRVL